jgi:hypothetical protein
MFFYDIGFLAVMVGIGVTSFFTARLVYRRLAKPNNSPRELLYWMIKENEEIERRKSRTPYSEEDFAKVESKIPNRDQPAWIGLSAVAVFIAAFVVLFVLVMFVAKHYRGGLPLSSSNEY